jgi:putative ABC transport system permease protein
MFSLAVRTLRHRKAGFAGAFVALLCAAALVCACGILLETGLRGSVAPERYAGTPILVAGDQNMHQQIRKKDKVKHKAKPIADRAWVPAEVADRLRRLPGVRQVVTEVTFPASLKGDWGWGHGWESAALAPVTLRDGRAPRAAGEIVVEPSAGLRPGASAQLLTPDGPARYTVVGVTAQRFASQRAIYFAAEEARRLAGHAGFYSAIGVFPAGVDVRPALEGTSAAVRTGDARGKVEFLGADNARIKLISMGAALGGTSLLVAILVVSGTFTLSIQQRLRELALLRAVGATPRQVRRLVGREALMVGMAAAVPGACAGIGLAFWLRGRFVGLDVMPANLQLVLSPFPVIVATLATVGAGWAAARLAARRSARVRPVEALDDAALANARTPWLRLPVGLAVLAGAVTLTLVLSGLHTEAAAGPVTILTALAWTTAVALLAPLLARVAFSVLGLPLKTARTTGYLAAANLRAGSRRFAAVITPLTLLVGLAGTILFSQTTMSHAAAGQAQAGTLAEHIVGPLAPASAAATVRKVPGVRTVTQVKRTTVRVGLTKRSAQGVTPAGLTNTMDLGLRSGSLAKLGPGTVAVRAGMGLEPADRVKLTLADGTPVTLEVIAVYARGLGFGDLTLDHDLVAAHVDVPLSDALLVSAPGVQRSVLTEALRPFPGLGIPGKETVAAEQQASSAEVNYFSLGLIIAFAAIAVVNTLAMSTADRAREFGLLRLIGTTRRQVMRMLHWETLAVLLISTVLGTAIALVTLTAFSSGMTGTAMPHIPPLTYLAIVVVAATLASLATILPARLALRLGR